VLRIEVVCSPAAGVVDRWLIELPAGSTVRDALLRCGLENTSGVEAQGLSVWGKRCEPGHPLRDGDRVALCRPLRVDPMDARRERERVQAAGRRARRVPPSGTRR